MKYKLLKSLPDIEVGTIIEYRDDKYFFESWSEVHKEFNDIFYRIFHRDLKDWYEEVKKPKTICDLKLWDKYWHLDIDSKIYCYTLSSNHLPTKEYITSSFFTEREAKRNKLLREIATRIDKWLPKEDEMYTTIHREWPTEWCWTNDNLETLYYNQWLIFRNEEE